MYLQRLLWYNEPLQSSWKVQLQRNFASMVKKAKLKSKPLTTLILDTATGSELRGGFDQRAIVTVSSGVGKNCCREEPFSDRDYNRARVFKCSPPHGCRNTAVDTATRHRTYEILI